MRRRKAQEYSAAEFEAVVALLRNDERARRDIEAITGHKLTGKTAREIFDLYLTVQEATEVKVTFARYARAGVVLNEARRDLEGQASVVEALEATQAEVKELKTVNQSLRRTLDQERTAHNNAIAAPAAAVHSEGTSR